MRSKNEHGLTPQQEKFSQEVARGKSLADAYRESYKAGKMKPAALHVAASQLANDHKVSIRIKALQAAAADLAVLDSAEIMREIRRVSLSDIAGIMHQDGKVKLPHELDPATRAAVSGFKIDEYGRIEYKFWDKNTALTNAAKIKGLFKEDNEQQKPPVVREIRLIPLKPKSQTK